MKSGIYIEDMKKNIKWQDELVTKGYFRKELNRAITPLKKADAKLREELHATEYRLDTKIDLLRAEIREGMKKQTQIFQDLADKALGYITTSKLNH